MSVSDFRVWCPLFSEDRNRLTPSAVFSKLAAPWLKCAPFNMELRPQALVEGQLGDLLNRLGEAFTGQSRIPILLNINGNAPISLDVVQCNPEVSGPLTGMKFESPQPLHFVPGCFARGTLFTPRYYFPDAL
jgi:hypothetical protein